MSAEVTAEGGHGAVPTEGVATGTGTTRGSWPLYEVFVRGKRGLNHVHVGSLHAPDPEMAVHAARDLYTRRNEGVSIWVVRSGDITASSPDEKDPMFAPSGGRLRFDGHLRTGGDRAVAALGGQVRHAAPSRLAAACFAAYAVAASRTQAPSSWALRR